MLRTLGTLLVQEISRDLLLKKLSSFEMIDDDTFLKHFFTYFDSHSS